MACIILPNEASFYIFLNSIIFITVLVINVTPNLYESIECYRKSEMLLLYGHF